MVQYKTKKGSLSICDMSDVISSKAKLPMGSHPEITPSFFTLNSATYMTVSTAYTVLTTFKKG